MSEQKKSQDEKENSLFSFTEIKSFLQEDKDGNSHLSLALEEDDQKQIKTFLKEVYSTQDEDKDDLIELVQSIAMDVTKESFRQRHHITQKGALKIYSDARDFLDYNGEITEEVVEAFNF